MDKNLQTFSNLGLEVIAPFRISFEVGDLVAPMLVKNFGGIEGMIIVYKFDDIKPYLNYLNNYCLNKKLLYGFSVLTEDELNPDTDIEATIEMLNDWGWTGDIKDKPNFLTG